MTKSVFDDFPFKEFREYLKLVTTPTGTVFFDDIDLMKIHNIARWVYVLDVEQATETPNFTFRFVGTALCEGIGFEPTGKRLDDLDFGPGKESWINAYRTICKTGKPHVLSMTHYPDVPNMSPFKKEQPNCLLRLIVPAINADLQVTNIVGIGQFIPQSHPEAGKFYEVKID